MNEQFAYSFHAVIHFKLISLNTIKIRKHPYHHFKTKLIGAGVRDSCLEKRVQGRPKQAHCAEEAPGPPRKASALRSNQRSNFKNLKQPVDILNYYRVCLQAVCICKRKLTIKYCKKSENGIT
ncbi:hypothetical protein SRABI133_04777 [Peribacillus simplex]|uniref:Uncharacterized protein n=1 Tax=Peribacillus simplex TaxID=1478 RepID=A0A9W4L8M9_9BACI|nr:hypothetical protein SRABI133_04777 [Peribacillus simplex]